MQEEIYKFDDEESIPDRVDPIYDEPSPDGEQEPIDIS